MTDEAKLSRERIEEIRRGCEGVTPGPWYQTGSPWFHSGDGVLAGSPDGNIAYLIADCDDGMNPRDEYTEGGGPFPLGDKDADAAHIARLDPATVRALCTLALKGLDAGEGKPVAWLHPISGWANEDREFVAVHCQKDGPQPIPLYARPSPADGAVEALEWYAEQVAGCRKITSEGDAARKALDADGGKRAVTILTALKENDNE